MNRLGGINDQPGNVVCGTDVALFSNKLTHQTMHIISQSMIIRVKKNSN